MEHMPAVLDWPDDGRMTYHGICYKIQNHTEDPFPFVIRHQPGLSKTALLLQVDLMKILDREEAMAVSGQMAPKRYIL